MKISEKRMEEIKSVQGNLEKLQRAIGNIEIDKQRLIGHSFELSNRLEKMAEEALLESGISSEDLKNNKIDIQTGNVISLEGKQV